MRRALIYPAVLAIAIASVAACSSSGSDEGADGTTTTVNASEVPGGAATSVAPSSTTPGEGAPGEGAGGEAGGTDGSGEQAEGGSAPAEGPLELLAAPSELGQIVVDSEGRALYVYVDGDTTSCSPGCDAEWPPLVGEVTAGRGISAELGTVAVGNGRQQVTLAGRPLYYYAGDESPGTTGGQGVGGTWFVVNGAGDPHTSS